MNDRPEKQAVGQIGHVSNRPDPEDTHRTIVAIRQKRRDPVRDQLDFNPRVRRTFGTHCPVRYQYHRLFLSWEQALGFAQGIAGLAHVKWAQVILRGNVQEPWLVVYGHGEPVIEPGSPPPTEILHTETFTIRVHGTPVDFQRAVKIKAVKYDGGLEAFNEANSAFIEKCLWSPWVRLQRIGHEGCYLLEYSLGNRSQVTKPMMYDRYSGRVRMRPSNG